MLMSSDEMYHDTRRTRLVGFFFFSVEDCLASVYCRFIEEEKVNSRKKKKEEEEEEEEEAEIRCRCRCSCSCSCS